MSDDRSQFIGGSDVAAIHGISPWKSPFQLYLEKIGAVVDEPTPEKQRIFARGKRWEPVVVDMLVDELTDSGHDVLVIGRNLRFPDPQCPFLQAEIDLRLQLDGEVVNGEMKTVHPFAAKEWGEPGSDDIPLHYAAQCMHGLMVTGKRLCIVAALIGADDLRIHKIERDDETIAAMRTRELEFWRRVQERDPPDPTTAEDVKWLYGRDAGIVMDADEELARICAELHYQKTCARHCEKAIEKLSTRLKLAMGHASTLIYQGQKIATWKSNKDSTKTDWQAAYLDLAPAKDHIQKFIKSAPGNRPLLIK